MSEIFQRLAKSFAASVHSDATNREEGKSGAAGLYIYFTVCATT